MHFFFPPLFPAVKVKKRMPICLSRAEVNCPVCLGAAADSRPTVTADGRGCDIARWEVKRGNCGDEILLWLSGAICTWRREVRRRGGFAARGEFRPCLFLPTRAERYTCWQSSVTASTRQAPLHLHTECVPLYLFIHFHVAKCCHFDEWEMEPANCFHSTGQVSHALNLNVLLVLRSRAALRLWEAATASRTRVHRHTWRALRSFFLIRLYLKSWGCSLQFFPCRSGCCMPATRKPSERLEANPGGRVEVVQSEFGAFSSFLVTLFRCFLYIFVVCMVCNALCVALRWLTAIRVQVRRIMASIQ